MKQCTATAHGAGTGRNQARANSNRSPLSFGLRLEEYLVPSLACDWTPVATARRRAMADKDLAFYILQHLLCSN